MILEGLSHQRAHVKVLEIDVKTDKEMELNSMCVYHHTNYASGLTRAITVHLLMVLLRCHPHHLCPRKMMILITAQHVETALENRQC